jgi:hypothetical protein
MTGDAQRIAELEAEIERLQAANEELRRVNTRLAADPAAKLDSAAASALARRQRSGPSPARRLRGGVKARLRALALRVLR